MTLALARSCSRPCGWSSGAGGRPALRARLAGLPRASRSRRLSPARCGGRRPRSSSRSARSGPAGGRARGLVDPAAGLARLAVPLDPARVPFEPGRWTRLYDRPVSAAALLALPRRAGAGPRARVARRPRARRGRALGSRLAALAGGGLRDGPARSALRVRSRRSCRRCAASATPRRQLPASLARRRARAGLGVRALLGSRRAGASRVGGPSCSRVRGERPRRASGSVPSRRGALRSAPRSPLVLALPARGCRRGSPGRGARRCSRPPICRGAPGPERHRCPPALLVEPPGARRAACVPKTAAASTSGTTRSCRERPSGCWGAATPIGRWRAPPGSIDACVGFAAQRQLLVPPTRHILRHRDELRLRQPRARSRAT